MFDVPPHLVEAAALALLREAIDNAMDRDTPPSDIQVRGEWDRLDDSGRRFYTCMAQAALAAALTGGSWVVHYGHPRRIGALIWHRADRCPEDTHIVYSWDGPDLPLPTGAPTGE